MMMLQLTTACAQNLGFAESNVKLSTAGLPWTIDRSPHWVNQRGWLLRILRQYLPVHVTDPGRLLSTTPEGLGPL